MRKNIIIFVLIDLLILIVTFGIIHFNKFGYILPRGLYLILFIVFLSYWIILSKYYNKYSIAFSDKYLSFIKAVLWSTALTLFLITSTVSMTELRAISRQFLLMITIIPMFLEILIIGLLRTIINSEYILKDEESKTNEVIKTEQKTTWIIYGAFLLFFVYFLMIKIKTGDFYLYPWSERILLIVFASWLISLLLTNKYSIITTSNIYNQIGPSVKSGLIMLLIAAMVYFFFRIESLSRFLLFGTILIYSLFETLIFFIYYISKKQENEPNINNLLNKNNFSWSIEDFNYDTESEQYNTNQDINIRSIFNQISYLEDKNQIVDFLEKNLKNITINFYSSSILSTRTLENIEIIRDNSNNLLINLHKLNDMRHLNQYLITSYTKLISGGILVGNVLPNETTFNRLQNQMPKLLFTILYPFYFIVVRVIPKLPKLCSLYFFITQGKNRALSKAEMYGRLNFCGFKIQNEKLINDKLYFIARKEKTISTVENPSYHPLVKLKRIGLNGKSIYIYKFRTMYPYSEFLQGYVYDQNELTESGNKFENDFRITNWGKVLRMFWMDELPQLFNWLHGDLNLVGIRALSEQYFNLYPKDHQDFRMKFKPGLIPPFYADLPKTFEDKILSERKYLEQKLLTPFKTDIKYGFKAIINIIFKGARSS